MGVGIQICGLNGGGKSTLGRALAEALSFHFIDNEFLYFSRKHTDEPYGNPRSWEEVKQLLMDEVHAHPNFVFAAVKGDYGSEIIPLYDYVVMIEVPKSIRSQRIRNRSFQKFGDRILSGGDLYEREEAFFRMAESRSDRYVEDWLQTLKCPVIRVDGTKPVEENLKRIVSHIHI